MASDDKNTLTFVEGVRNDFLPSIVVFLVALPLCLGIAIASGAPLMTGLVTGVIGGLIVGWIAGSPLQVSGPAAGLTVIVYEMFRNPAFTGSDSGFTFVMLAILLAGIMQIAAGAVKIGQWFRAVSPAVIQGMLAGIGVLIFSSQFHKMVDDPPRQIDSIFGVSLTRGLQELLTIPESIYHIFVPVAGGSTHQWAAGLGVLTIVVIVLWKRFAPKKLKLIPGPLLGVALATILAMVFHVNVLKLDILFVPPEQTSAVAAAAESADLGPDEALDPVDAAMAAASMESEAERLARVKNFSIWDEVQFPRYADWPSAPWQAILIAAVGLALVASAETLLCATAVDQMHKGARTQYDRELMAQGVGNSLCGLLGGLPMTGVIVRSAANVEAGGKTRMSAVMHGLWLLLFVAFFAKVLMEIPISSLAAVLVYTGWKLVNPTAIRKLAAYGRGEVAIYFVTLAVIVGKDLLTGVIAGIVLATLKLLYTFSRLNIRIEEDPGKRRTMMYLEGTATFLRLPKLAAALEQIPKNTELHVRFEQLDYIDHACLDLLMNWERQHKTTGGVLTLDWESLTARFRGDNGSNSTISVPPVHGRPPVRETPAVSAAPSPAAELQPSLSETAEHERN